MIAGGIFRQDNPYNTVMNRIGDIAMLSVAWFVCCLPVVTIGVSTAAACEVAREMQEDRDLWWISRSMAGDMASVLYGVTLAVFIIVAMLFAFLLPLSGRSKLSAGEQIKQSAKLATMKPFIALVVAAIYALPIVLLATLPSAVMWVPLVWCIFGGGASAWAQMWLIRRAFDLQPQD